MRYLVTGGAGFIGSAVCRQLVANPENQVVNLDKLTYSGNPQSLMTINGAENYRFVHGDIGDIETVMGILSSEKIDLVMNLAAETHVDRSIVQSDAFIESNVIGTHNLLKASNSYFEMLSGESKAKFRFHHVSTDEVFGDLPFNDAVFDETSRYAPSSPYAASKASSDHLVRAWYQTYGLPVIVSNCTNNYGPFQLPEKLIPLIILNALREKSLPLYGNGKNVRDWLYVDDHVEALTTIVTTGTPGETYVVGGRTERTNIEIVEAICSILDRKIPRSNGHSYGDLVKMVADRPGHDLRYAIDPSKIERELGWRAKTSLVDGLESTVDWYMNNEWWWTRFDKGPGVNESMVGRS